jgi:uncharacterized delta-60 repeat protein
MCRINQAVGSVVESLENRRLLTAGDLDLTFGIGGRYVDPHELEPTDLAVQPDGKLLVSGTGLSDVGSVLRLNADGTPDTPFGSHGYATSGFGPFVAFAYAVAAGPGGRITVAGFAGPYRDEIPSEATLVVYNANGTPDRSFDGDGILLAPQFPRGFTDVAFQADGKILALGEKLVRYNADGTLDKSFDVDGVVDKGGKRVAVDAGGRIVVLGDYAVFRFNPNGSPDTTFDGDGVLPNIQATDLAIAPDGDILVAGRAPTRAAVSRFNADGGVDDAWSTHGTAYVYGTTLTATADHVYTGYQIPGQNSSNDELLITALDARGRYDESFGLHGTTRTPFDTGPVRAVAVAMQGGKLVGLGAVGERVGNPPSWPVRKPALARYELTATGQTPFNGTPINVLNGVPLYRFDNGGEGVAYHDTEPADLGKGPRPSEGVDLQQTSDVSRPVVVAFVKAGEWLEYTVSVPPAGGTFDLGFGVSHLRKGGTFHLEVDGRDVTGRLAVPQTGDWTRYTTVTKPGVALAGGTHLLRLAFDTAGDLGYVGNFDRIDFRPGAPPATQQPFGPTPYRDGERVESENFDRGGEGVAYHDVEPANLGGANYRPGEGVDVQPTTDAGGGYNVGFLKGGEWLEYTMDFVQSGPQVLNVRAASKGAGGTFRVLINGYSLGNFVMPDTGGWQTFTTLSKSLYFGPSRYVIRFEALGEGPTHYVANLNWFEFKKA